MQTNQADHAGVNRLRYVLDGKVATFTFSAAMSFGEVAERLSTFPRRHHGRPTTIDITLANWPTLGGGHLPFPPTARSIIARHSGAAISASR